MNVQELQDKKLTDLKQIAKGMNLKGISMLRKQDLIGKIMDHDTSPPPAPAPKPQPAATETRPPSPAKHRSGPEKHHNVRSKGRHRNDGGRDRGSGVGGTAHRADAGTTAKVDVTIAEGNLPLSIGRNTFPSRITYTRTPMSS